MAIDCVNHVFVGDPALRAEQLSPEQIADLVRADTTPIWVDVDSTLSQGWPNLAERMGFHPLPIEDTLSPECRVKLEEYDHGIFIVVRDAFFATETPQPYDFESVNLYLFLGHHYLVTVHAGKSRPVDTLVERLRNAPEMIDRGADYLAYNAIDTLVDLYFPLLDEIDAFVDAIESDVYENAGRQESVQLVFELKRTLLALRRHQAPMREVMSTLANRPFPCINTGTQIYFRDVYDHVVRQIESVETYRDLVSGVMDLYFSVVSNRMNEVIKALSIIATIVLPPTLIAGIYGMNFENGVWPSWHNPYGFLIAIVLMVVVTGGLWVYLKAKRWL